MKHFLNRVAAALLTAAVCMTPALADDVEIYFNTTDGQIGDPLVMFSLDYRPNLAATICNFTLITECGWDADFNDALTDVDKVDGTIDFLEMLRAALKRVLSEVTGVRVGLMLNHDNKNNCENKPETNGCSNGGYIVQGFTAIDGNTTTTAGGEDLLLSKLASLPSPQGNLSHPYQGKELYFEFYRYLAGRGIYNGHVGRIDYDDDCGSDNLDNNTANSCVSDSDDGYPVRWDTAIEADPAADPSNERYVSPFTDSDTECSSVYAINFMFGVANQEDDSDDAITESKADDGMAGINISGRYNNFGSLIEWLNDNDMADGTSASPTGPSINSGGADIFLEGNQNVTSYFLYKGNVQNTMDGYAIKGGTGQAIEVTDNPQELIDSLTSVFEEILRQNSTFEAPAVTVNSYTRLTHLDELFFALFGPEETPDWPGNMKKYKLGSIGVDTNGDGDIDEYVVRIEDSAGNEAVDQNTALFKVTSCSYWSNCSIDRDEDGSVDADGDTVAWGGAAEEQTVAETTGNVRLVFTDVSTDTATNVTLVDLHEDTTTVTATLLGLTVTNATDIDDDDDADSIDTGGDGDVDSFDVATQRKRLLQLGRGLEYGSTDTPLQTLGDPIHSRPAVIVYNDDVTRALTATPPTTPGIAPDLAIAMTTNEGFLHLIDASDGSEFFAFMPKEELTLLKTTHGPAAFDGGAGGSRFGSYGLDGSPLIWRNDANDDGVITTGGSDSVYIYLTQRRGGRNIYALDITNRTNPLLKWKILGGTTTGFTELGQTWSEPQLATIKVSGSDTKVLVFGGGYDTTQDSSYSRSDTVGRAIYVVNADTGALIWSISDGGTDLSITQMDSSIPANVKTLDVDEDGYLDRIYAVDVAGRMFRIDFSNTTTSTTIHGGGMVASLYDATCVEDAPVAGVARECHRRFYNSPDVAVMVGYPVSPYVQIAVGSGFRPHPVTVTGIQDRFYVVFDTHVIGAVDTGDYSSEYHWLEETNIIDVTAIDQTTPTGDDTAYDVAESSAQAALLASDVHGWFIDMDDTLHEQVLSESVTIQGNIIFTTYLRDDTQANACEPNLGQGRIYVLGAFNGLPVADLYTGTLAGELETVTEGDRFKDLDRSGIPSDPLVVFREDSEGNIVPTVVVTTELPLPPGILGQNLYSKTWWIDVD
ncbi:MAG: hypothetical protein ABW168_19825 [Sedimenticola sp.]